MNAPRVGSRVRVVSNTCHHGYTIGSTLVVVHVDAGDSTLRARKGDSGAVGSWINWADCAPAKASVWRLLSKDLPEETRLFLSAFEGIDDIGIDRSVADEILTQLPDLAERIVAYARTEEGAEALGLSALEDEKL
ncbi:MAG: hypothetical protein WCJ30_15810 [Deltaproteobacteria bacterium]